MHDLIVRISIIKGYGQPYYRYIFCFPITIPHSCSGLVYVYIIQNVNILGILKTLEAYNKRFVHICSLWVS